MKKTISISIDTDILLLLFTIIILYALIFVKFPQIFQN